MLILILAAFMVLVPRVALTQCVDYGDYLQKMGSVDTPKSEWDVAISGTKAYVVTKDYSGGWTSSLQVIDLSNPAFPTVLGSLALPSEALGVAASGGFAYVANSNQGLQVIDVSNPASPHIVGTVHTPGNNARAVALSGTIAYVADCSSGIQFIDVSNPAAPTIVGYANTPACALDVAVQGNILYVAANVAGLQLIDISNPALPAFLGRWDTPGTGEKVAVYGSVALIGDSGGYDMAIIDVSNPLSLKMIPNTFYISALDVAVSPSGVAFVTGGGLVTLDISNPDSLQVLGRSDDASGAVAVSSQLACVVAPGGVVVFDASNPASPPILGYLGQGSLSVAMDGTNIYTTSRTRNATCPYPTPPCQSILQVFDASNPQFPPAAALGTVNTPGYADGIAASGTTVYVADGDAGLEIVDVSNPSVPQIIGNANTPGVAVDVDVSGMIAFVADGSSGVQVIDVSNPAAPLIIGSVDTPDYAWGIDVSGSLACVADRSSGLQVIDVANPRRPKIVGNVDTPGNAMDVAISGSLVFVTDDDPGAGFQVINVSNPHTPNILTTLDLPSIANGIAVTGSIAYVAAGTEGIQVIDVSNPSSPVILGTAPSPGSMYRKIATSSQMVCMIDGNGHYPLVLPLQCLTPPVVANPGTRNGAELEYFSMTLTATDTDQGGLTMTPVGSLPPWATFTDAGSGTAYLSGIPQSGQAGTYPISIRAADDETATTVSFNIMIAPAGQTGIGDGASLKFRFAAAPNPFWSGLELEFDLERGANVSVTILDLQGRKVRDVVTGEFPAGSHRASWDGRDDLGQPVGPGLYFARLTTSDGHVQVQKLFKIR